MNKKFTTHSPAILKTKAHIRTLFPELQNILVKISKTAHGQFKAQIVATAPKRKRFVAQKVSSTYLRSLEKCERAILGQLEKNQAKTSKTSPIKMYDLLSA